MNCRVIVCAAALALLSGGCTRVSPSLAEQGAASAQPIEVTPPREGAVAWRQWRGPSLDGSTTEAERIASPKLKLTPRWEREVGVGYSAAAVDGGRVFISGYDGEDTLYCLNADTGEVGWQFSYPANNFDSQNVGGPSGSPSYVDGRVTTVSRDGIVYCLGAEDGKLLWAKKLADEVGVGAPKWGFSGSPIVHGDHVLIDVGVIAALDCETGAIKWKTKKSYGPGYSSPVPFTHGGKACVAVFPEEGLFVLDEATGEELAHYYWSTRYGVNAATPLVSGDEIFISTGYGTGCALVRFDGESLEEVWKNKNMRAHMASPVRWDGHIYGFDEGRLVCIDAKTGEQKWSITELRKGCLIRAEGTLIALGANGELQIGPASPAAWAPTTKLQVLDASGCWSAPVLSGDRLYCRSPDGKLVCLDVKTE